MNSPNEIGENIKFTFETETDQTLLSFDILIIRETHGTLETTIDRKQSNTGLTINPFSKQNLNT